jgi:hypothetical protein
MEGNNIYILLVFALLCWRRPARPANDAQLHANFQQCQFLRPSRRAEFLLFPITTTLQAASTYSLKFDSTRSEQRIDDGTSSSWVAMWPQKVKVILTIPFKIHNHNHRISSLFV